MSSRTGPVRPEDQSSQKAEDALQEQVAAWLKKKGSSGSPETVREAMENATGFFSILREWERADTTGNEKDGADGGQG